MELSKAEELKLWEQARERYGRIGDLLSELFNKGIACRGSETLNIPKCGFCEKVKELNRLRGDCCIECPWSEKLGKCSEDNSAYNEFYDAIEDSCLKAGYIYSKICKIISELQAELQPPANESETKHSETSTS